MGRLKNFKGFSDKFKEKLNLTKRQISQIEEVEYNFHKDYRWNKISVDKQNENTYLSDILKNLNNEQLEIYKKFVKDQKVKNEKRRKEKFDKTFEVQSIRLKALNLTNEQLETYIKKKLNFTELRLQKMKQAKTQAEMELDVLEQKIYEEEIFPIFNTKQLTKYKDLKKTEEIKREEEGKKWKTKHEKEMFKHNYNIDLNEEQANVLFSKDFNLILKDAKGEYLSDFEKMERERNWYEKHLTEEQFKVYQPFYEEKVKYKIEDIKKSNDKHDKVQLQRTKNYLEYYIEHVLPHVIESRKRIETKLTIKQKKLIEEIRLYYFAQQDINRDKFVKQHKRHYKAYKPNALSEFRLRQKIEKLNFNFYYLYGYGPTKELMDSQLQLLLDEEDGKLEKVYAQLKEFNINNYESTGGSYGSGWVMKVSIKEGEEHLEKIGILLLHPNLNTNLELIEQQ
jgi:hypothetical protein